MKLIILLVTLVGAVLPAFSTDTISLETTTPPLGESTRTHLFFDRENTTLFTFVAISRGMDCQSTWQFRRYGTNEGELTNKFVDNKPLFAAYSVGMVGLNVVASYALHRRGWHKAEHLLAVVHIGLVTEAVNHNYETGMRHLPPHR